MNVLFKTKVFFILMLLGQNLFAADSAFTIGDAVSANDMSMNFLGQIFAGLIPGVGATGADIFKGGMLAFLNSVVLVAGILAAYTILVGTIGTAHDGEMLGKRFSSVWIPIRYSIGSALILPVVGTGDNSYALIQKIVMWCVMQGVGIANYVWGAYVDNILNQADRQSLFSAKVNMNQTSAFENLAEQVYLMQVCVKANKKSMAYTEHNLEEYEIINIAQGSGAGTSSNWGMVPKQEDTHNLILFGDSSSNSSISSCGSIKYPKKPEVRQFSATSTNNRIQSLTFTPPNGESIWEVHNKHINLIVTAMDSLAETNTTLNVDNTQKDTTTLITYGQNTKTKISELALAYSNELKTTTDTLLRSSGDRNKTEMITAMKQQGWFLAGTWFSQLIHIQNNLSTLAKLVPETTYNVHNAGGGPRDYTHNALDQGLKSGTDLSKKIAQELSSKGCDKQSSACSSEGTTALKSMKTDDGILLNFLKNSIFKTTSIDKFSTGSDDRHPILVMSSLGQDILDGIWTGLIVALTGSAIATFIGGLASAIVTFGSLAAPLIGFIAGAGALAYILPNLPFFIWMGIIIGWTLMVVEAIIAAPLWIVMHLNPNGDDLTGKGGNGYSLLLSLILRPVLIIFGFIAALTLSDLFGSLVNKIFFDIFRANTNTENLGFLATIFFVVTYAVLMYKLLMSSFNIMHQIPDQLLRWIGGGDNQLGQFAGQLGAEGVTTGTAIAGQVISQPATQAVQGLGQAAQGAKQAAQSKKQFRAEMDQAAKVKAQNIQRANAADIDTANSVGIQPTTMAALNNESGVKNNGEDFSKDEISAKSRANDKASTVAKDKGDIEKATGNSDASNQYESALQENLNQGQNFAQARDNALSSTLTPELAATTFNSANAGKAFSNLYNQGKSSKLSNGMSAKKAMGGVANFAKSHNGNASSLNSALGQANTQFQNNPNQKFNDILKGTGGEGSGVEPPMALKDGTKT